MEKIAEKNKKPGVCYAWTDETASLPALELPVIDITHPTFAFKVNDTELNTLIDLMARSAAIPPSSLVAAARTSTLVRGMVESAGTYTTGMMTYLNKLEPANLGEGFFNPMDRQWASGLTPLTFRWRMRDVARLLADGFGLALERRPGRPAHLLNIAGGPAMDSLNALILLRKERPALLAGRAVSLHVLDLDEEGPSFGARALAALQAEGGPLQGLAAAFIYHPYNWSEPAALAAFLAGLEPEAAVAGSSEGGLFEYAADDVISANLQVLQAGTPADTVLVGPVIRSADTLDPRLQGTEKVPGRPAVRYIGLEAFARLAAAGGWAIARHLDGPMHQVVSLQKVLF